MLSMLDDMQGCSVASRLDDGTMVGETDLSKLSFACGQIARAVLKTA